MNERIAAHKEYMTLAGFTNAEIDEALMEAGYLASGETAYAKGGRVGFDTGGMTDKMGLGNGQYDIRVCIYRNYIYEVDLNSETNKPGAPGTVQIEEISPSRNEIRVKATLQKYNKNRFKSIN